MRNEVDLAATLLDIGLSNGTKDSVISQPMLNWRIHPFGFLRLDVTPTLRLHVWHPELQKPGVSMIHDHAQWDFESTVLLGAVMNVRFVEVTNGVLPYMRGTIVAGTLEGGLTCVKETFLCWEYIERIDAGKKYNQIAEQIHKTEFLPGTITLVRKTPRETDKAHVFWPKGSEWVPAVPRMIESGDRGLAKSILAQAASNLKQAS